MALTISIETGDTADASARIMALLEEANADVQHPRNEKHFCATLRGEDGDIVGGITARSFWGWLYIIALAIHPSWRGRGYGRQLLVAAESWGIECECGHAWLMTMSFQAPEFYERAGYVVFAELNEFPGRERRLFMRKALPQEKTEDRRQKTEDGSGMKMRRADAEK
jgi:GNAT superfamily N-acetyltransferase